MGDGERSASTGRFVGVCELTAATAAAICGRIVAGEMLSEVCRDPAMPERTTVYAWTKRDPVFAAQLGVAVRTLRMARRRRDLTAGEAAAGRAASAKGGRPSGYSPEIAEAICARLANGESLIAIARDAEMPCYGTVYGWLKRHPEFADAYVTARQVQADYLFDEAREVALAATPKTVWAERLRFDVIRWQTARMAPKKYCERVIVEAEVAARMTDEAEAAGLGGDHLVIVKRYSDITPEEEAASEATERLYEARAAARARLRRARP